MQVWHNQQFAEQQNAYNLDNSQEYDISERTHLDLEGALTLVALKNDTTASKDQDRRHGSVSNLETSEAGYGPVPSQQALGSVVSQGETGRDVPTQDSQELKSLVPDQVCTCAACLQSYTYPSGLFWERRYPETLSWKFGCRITGCQWTTDDVPQVVGGHNALQHLLLWHEKERSHYGKPGDYRCLETGCKFVTKRFRDLLRHSSSKHCIKPQIFKCAVLDCKYHETGFARKDKRKSHYQNVHQGKPQPGKANQAIKPKVKDGA